MTTLAPDTSDPVRPQPRIKNRLLQHPWRPATTPHLTLALLLFAAYTLTALLRYNRYSAPSWDLGIFTETVKAYAHLHAPTVPIKGDGYNQLGDHFSPILATLAPLWWAWPSPVMLLTAQAGLFAWSAGIVSDTAARLLGASRGLCIGVAYGLSFGIQRAMDVDFHEIAFAVPILAIVCRQLLLRQWARAAWWTLPLLLVKEDLGLTAATVGLLLLANRRWRAGTILLVGGIAATAVTVLIVIPHFNPAGHYDYWTKLPGGTHPHWWQLATGPLGRLQTWKTLGWTFGITGMLALRSPLILLAAPTLLWRLTSTNEAFWGIDWHYSAVLMPIVFLALADAARRSRGSRRMWARQFADRTVTAVPAVAVAVMVALPVGLGNLANADAWTSGRAGAARTAALQVIPDGARVEATNAVLAPLAARTDAYWMGGSKKLPPDYIVLDRNDWHDAPQGAAAAGYGTGLHPGAIYRVVFQRGDVTVVRRLP
jgi:uncharacterized membrane protein